MPKIEPLRWSAAQHSRLFKVHSQATGNAYTRDHTSNRKDNSDGRRKLHYTPNLDVRINHGNEKDRRIMDLLRNNDFFLSEHRWPEDIWNTRTQSGFILGNGPQVYDPDQVKEKILQELCKNLSPSTRLSKFAVAFCSPSDSV